LLKVLGLEGDLRDIGDVRKGDSSLRTDKDISNRNLFENSRSPLALEMSSDSESMAQQENRQTPSNAI